MADFHPSTATKASQGHQLGYKRGSAPDGVNPSPERTEGMFAILGGVYNPAGITLGLVLVVASLEQGLEQTTPRAPFQPQPLWGVQSEEQEGWRQ